MFVLASTHKEIVSQLKSEIAFLRHLVSPQTKPVPLVHMEADAILNGQQEQIEIANDDVPPPVREEQEEALNALLRERDVVLSGNF